MIPPQPTQSTQTGATPTTSLVDLNVILHGLWGLEHYEHGIRDESGIRAVSPDLHEHDHVIQIGDFSATLDVSKKVPSRYSLEGVDAASRKNFASNLNFVVGKGRLLDSKKVIAFEFPYPTKLESIRLIQTGGDTYFVGDDAPKTPEQIAMVQVLTYVGVDPGKLRLPPLETLPKPHEENGKWYINVHLFAEPPNKEVAAEIVKHEEMHPEEKPHYKVAFEALAAAFGLNITPIKMGNADPNSGRIPGVAKMDTIGLHELPPSGRAKLAASPINCEMLVVQKED